MQEDSYSFLKIDDVLVSLVGAKEFYTLALKNGYW